MLKFLTHKLRTHSLNEDHPVHFKADDDHDSGTESDDENGDTEDPESIMESEVERSSGSTVSPEPYNECLSASSPSSSLYYPDSALPSDSDHNCDHHSSEEELEVINSTSHCGGPAGGKSSNNNNNNNNISNSGNNGSNGKESLSQTCRTGGVTVPEKRKWSQVAGGGGTNTSCERVTTANGTCGGGTSCGGGGAGAAGPPVSASAAATAAAAAEHSSGSSDEEVQGLLAAMATPVQFRSSPPSNAHKPGHHSLSPPPKLFHYGTTAAAPLDVSPRKRHRHTPRAHHIQRPCLDFEKMQQLKARAVTAWRHSGDHAGELSVFCW